MEHILHINSIFFNRVNCVIFYLYHYYRPINEPIAQKATKNKKSEKKKENIFGMRDGVHYLYIIISAFDY